MDVKIHTCSSEYQPSAVSSPTPLWRSRLLFHSTIFDIALPGNTCKRLKKLVPVLQNSQPPSGLGPTP